MIMITSSMLLLSLVSMVRHHALLTLAPFQRLLHKVDELQNLPIKVLYLEYVCRHVRMYKSICVCIIFRYVYTYIYLCTVVLLGIFGGVKDAIKSSHSTMA